MPDSAAGPAAASAAQARLRAWAGRGGPWRASHSDCDLRRDSPETLSGMRRPGPRRPAAARESVARDRAAAGSRPAGAGCGGFKPGLGAATTAGETIKMSGL